MSPTKAWFELGKFTFDLRQRGFHDHIVIQLPSWLWAERGDFDEKKYEPQIVFGEHWIPDDDHAYALQNEQLVGRVFLPRDGIKAMDEVVRATTQTS